MLIDSDSNGEINYVVKSHPIKNAGQGRTPLFVYKDLITDTPKTPPTQGPRPTQRHRRLSHWGTKRGLKLLMSLPLLSLLSFAFLYRRPRCRISVNLRRCFRDQVWLCTPHLSARCFGALMHHQALCELPRRPDVNPGLVHPLTFSPCHVGTLSPRPDDKYPM